MDFVCKECGKPFNMSPKEQEFFISKHLELPKRCPECRKARKVAREEAEKQKKWADDERLLSDFLKSLPYNITDIKKLQFNNPDHSICFMVTIESFLLTIQNL
jgi:hypothetical protein